jgi:probable O-glycosylation ligase (exosortase A-associated)
MRALAFFGFLIFILPSIFIHPYIGVLLYSWLSFMAPHRLLWVSSSIPLAMIIAVLTLVAWFGSREPKRLHFDATVWLIVAFMAWMSFTTLLALNPVRAFDLWSRTLKELLFVLITIALTTNRIRLHTLLWVMAVSIGYFGLKGGLGTILHGGGFAVYGPPDTAIENNNDIGAGLVVALPLMNYVRISSANLWVGRGWLVAMACSFLAIVGSYSRGAALGLVAISLFLWLKSAKKLLSGFVIGLTLVAAVAFMPEQYMQRMQTIQTYQEDESAMSRIRIWGVAIKIALERPLTGGGFAVTESQQVVNRLDPGFAMHAVHNVFLAVLAEHGFIGLLIWGLMLLVGWRNGRWLVRHAADRPELQWAGDFGRMSQVALVGYCVVGSFGNYEYWDYYFTIIGLLAAARHIMEPALLPLRSATTSRAALSPAVP